LEQLKTLYSEIEGLPPDRIVPTVGLNIGRAEAYKSKLIFWDLGGQVKIYILRELVLGNAQSKPITKDQKYGIESL
jgi:ADP-ribosylation factor related protein 1